MELIGVEGGEDSGIETLFTWEVGNRGDDGVPVAETSNAVLSCLSLSREVSLIRLTRRCFRSLCDRVIPRYSRRSGCRQSSVARAIKRRNKLLVAEIETDSFATEIQSGRDRIFVNFGCSVCLSSGKPILMMRRWRGGRRGGVCLYLVR